MEIYSELDAMRPFIAARDWPGLEQRFADTCRRVAGEEAAGRIAAVSLTAFESALKHGLSRAIAEATKQKARAVYFEYDLDNDWQSAFFICPQYSVESVGDDDWACDFTSHFAGPDLEKFSKIYRERGFDRTPEAIGCTTLLVARTIAAYGRASASQTPGGVILCAAFHDQTPIVRIREEA